MFPGAPNIRTISHNLLASAFAKDYISYNFMKCLFHKTVIDNQSQTIVSSSYRMQI